MITTLLGPPGTGKTHSLIEKVQEGLQRGIKPERIGYFAFTNRAADEAKFRAMEKFQLPASKLPYFRTLHSLAFNQLGLSKTRVFSKEAMREFANWMGLELSHRSMNWEEGMFDQGATDDDRTLFLLGLMAIKEISFEEAIQTLDWQRADLDVIRIWEGLNKFKRARSLIDFNDMLKIFCDRGVIPELDLIIVDEAQDLSHLQWRVVNLLTFQNNNPEVWFAGDDDQAIYEWAGADIKQFQIYAEMRSKTLSQSYRVPKDIQLASLKLIGQVSGRVKKFWQPAEHEGYVKFIQQPEEIFPIKGTILHLARHFHLLHSTMRWLEEEEIPWGYLHQTQAPYLLSTIHGAKGAQADNVILDLAMTRTCYDQIDTDAEKRVWYTAMTRAKYNLFIIEPYTRCNAEELLGG